MGRRSYTTVGGRAAPPPPIPLGAWRWVACGAAGLVLLLSIGLPYFALLRGALAKAWGLGWSWQNVTLRNFRYVIFEFDPTRSAIVNTLELATVTATLAALLMGAIAYVAQRRLVAGAPALAFLAMAPLAIPGIVLSIGLFKAYSRPPVLLYGTIWLIFVAYLTKYLPIAYTACHAALQTVHVDLEDAARMLGANRLTAFKDVTVPLFGVGLVSAWLLVFLPSLRELSSSILLFTTRSRVVAVVIYTLYEEGLWEAVCALGILLLGLTLAPRGGGAAVPGPALPPDLTGEWPRSGSRASPSGSARMSPPSASSRSRSATASSCPSSDLRAAGRPRRSGSSPASSRPRRARSGSATGACPRRATRCLRSGAG